MEYLKNIYSFEFEMNDLGVAKKILGMEISRNREKGTLMVSQEDYKMNVFGNYNMDKSKSVSTPLENISDNTN